MFKHLLLFYLFFLLLSIEVWGQILQPAKWSASVAKKEIKAGEEVELIFTASIDSKWYVYSNDFDPELGPQLTSFTFKPHPSYSLSGKVVPIHPKRKFDDVWGGEVSFFKGKAEFRQKVKILKKDFKIEVEYSYQVCSDIDGKCIPGEGEFSFGPAEIKVTETTNSETKKETEQEKKEDNEKPQPEEDVKETQEDPKNEESKVVEVAENEKATEEKRDKASLIPTGATPSDESLWGFAVLAFFAGLVALLTPCVFPMIPMTVTFFTKDQSQKGGLSSFQKASIYGLSIIAIFTVLGTSISWINGPAFANWLSTHWIPNTFFFLIFFIFALSFLGMFEIVLPSSWVNRADQQADKGGIYGIFFMAFTLCLVSFSCTGPIVGSILVQSAGGAIIKPIVGMFSFSLAMAIPFGLFAAFPSWLSNLPKSGGWLNVVKVVLGFLELALALKFLSIVDQVYHLRILDRDVFLALWIVIFSMIGFYLLGKIKLPHDSPSEKVSVPSVILAILSFSFVVYLIPGMLGAPLKPLAGYLPPLTTMETANFYAPYSQNENKDRPKPKYSDILKLPHGLYGFFDYKEGMAYAKKENKPVFIDFTGHGCVNCREMEARVWADNEVLKRLRDKYVVIALYVDDKTQLPEKEWYTSTYDQRKKKSIGAQNADFQIRKFNNNAQPYYCLLDHKGELLVTPRAYDLNVSNFISFLDEGLNAFKGNKKSRAKN